MCIEYMTGAKETAQTLSITMLQRQLWPSQQNAEGWGHIWPLKNIRTKIIVKLSAEMSLNYMEENGTLRPDSCRLSPR